MKTLITFYMALIFILPQVRAAGQQGGGNKYKRLEQTDDKAKRVIAKLEKIKIDNISFKKLTSSEAMDYLTKKVVGDKARGVINLVIRGADQAKKIRITNKNLSYAQAVDEICRQSGRVWMIDFNETSGSPVLVFKNKNGQQDITPDR